MKRRLLDLLICPACLPREYPLKGTVVRQEGEDILSGRLNCPKCGTYYPVEDGVAILLPPVKPDPNSSQSRYEADAVVSAYLWSHFGDLFEDSEAAEAYSTWAGLISGNHAVALEAGCAVGRFTFEMSPRCEFVVGLDMSVAFVKVAKQLLKEGRVDFPLTTEGLLAETKTIVLEKGWRPERVEFIVADALALPFPKETFSLLASLNLLDKVPKPLLHLKEMDRTARQRGALFLFSDPFSWSEEVSRVEDWLGGKGMGEFSGEGIHNVRFLLEGGRGILQRPWGIRRQGAVSWLIRNHRNHYERIRSEYLLSER